MYREWKNQFLFAIANFVIIILRWFFFWFLVCLYSFRNPLLYSNRQSLTLGTYQLTIYEKKDLSENLLQQQQQQQSKKISQFSRLSLCNNFKFNLSILHIVRLFARNQCGLYGFSCRPHYYVDRLAFFFSSFKLLLLLDCISNL